MGYPQQSGQQFENVIYQGTVVRLYTVPKDPRSDAQLNQRRFLSDITKMRSMLGVFGKAAMKTALGSKWGTVIYQAIKADVESWWSNALEEWDNFGEVNQQAWRNAAPYQACFNDVGLIYFGLTRVLYQALLNWSFTTWGMALWAENESVAAAAWWARDLTSVMSNNGYDDLSVFINYYGSWASIVNASCFLGAYTKGVGSSGDYFEFFFIGSNVEIGYMKDASAGVVGVYIDGQFVQDVNQYNASPVYQWNTMFNTGVKKLHYVKVVKGAQEANVDFVIVSN